MALLDILAPRVGFEPTRPGRGHKLSRLPSCALGACLRVCPSSATSALLRITKQSPYKAYSVAVALTQFTLTWGAVEWNILPEDVPPVLFCYGFSSDENF